MVFFNEGFPKLSVYLQLQYTSLFYIFCRIAIEKDIDRNFNMEGDSLFVN